MAETRKNILLVFADQMRAGTTGAEGNAEVRTPTLDALARDGLALRQCIANSPVCSPSRASMLTGTYPTTHRVLSNDLPVRTDLPTLGTVARDAGYRTGYIGKWHIDGVPRSRFTPPGERRLGFDDFWAVYNCAHRYFDPKYYRDTPELVRVEGYEPTVQTDLAVEFLERGRADDRPFCLALSWGPPHDPYPEVPDAYRSAYDPRALTLPPNVVHPIENPLARRLEVRRTLADYYAAVTALDAELARLLSALERTGRADDTVVVFTSDHGDMLWSHGWMKKQAPYEESIHVPLFVRGPGLPRGRESQLLFGLVDLMPTLLSLAGLRPPATIEGRDWSEVLCRDDDDHDNGGRSAAAAGDAVLIMNTHACDEAAVQGMPEWRGVRTARHTYVERVGRTPWLLFDNAADPHQMTNLVDNPGHATLRRRLAATLAGLLRQSHDPFLPGGQLLAHFGLAEAWAHREQRIND